MAPKTPPPPFIFSPISAHTHTIILLHGLGSNGEKFGRELLSTAKTCTGLTLPQLLPTTKFIFPTARRRRSTAFVRAVLTMWFDKASLQDPSYRKETQLQGLEESAREILELLRHERELNHIPAGNIVIGGLSQGCAMSLTVLLCLDYDIGGFVGMSGYLPFRKDVDEAMEERGMDGDNPFADDNEDKQSHDAATRVSVFERELLGLPVVDHSDGPKTAQRTPVFLGHGSDDEQVPLSLGEEMAATMRQVGYRVEWKSYDGLGHWYKIPDEIDDIVEFLGNVVGWKLSADVTETGASAID